MTYFSRSSTRVPQNVTSILYRSLKQALVSQCRRRYDVDLSVRRLDAPADEAGARLQIECRGLLQVSGRLVVIPSGKETYEVFCTIEGTASQRRAYSRPEKWGTTLSHAPVLGRTLARFVCEELKKRLGHRLLQSPAGRASSGRPARAERGEP